MNPQLVKLFRNALDIAPPERRAYLDLHCSDPKLRAQLDSLLLAAEQTERPLPEIELPVLAVGQGTGGRNVELADRSGEQVGAFRLLKPIGSGGMGAVWLAERMSGFSQQVAIKWLHAGLSQSARRRFARERETLAKLEHPGIARIVDGGSERESDWFAMEYVDGVTLDIYVKRTQPSLSERIGLIVALCDAVQYAHQNLIVHRDLKPGNILVSTSGQPKLLDFGVAKVLDDSDATLSRAPMTFAYAAPEQIRGDAITTATDVYALGVILFELLTGERPHKAINRVGGDGSLSLLQAITDTDATAPSHVLSLQTANLIKPKQLRGDLDTIVLKALSREPTRRYASAQALLDDLQRFLNYQPIQAQADSAGYRLRKFVRRNRAMVVVSVLALLAVLGFAGRSMLDAQTARAARDLAQQETARAQAIQTFLTDLFSDQRPDAAQGRAITAKDLLDLAELRLQQPEFLSQASVRAALLDTLARLRYDMNDFESALRHNEASITLAEQRFGAGSAEYGIAVVERADTLWWLGRIDETLSECRRGLAVLRLANTESKSLDIQYAHQMGLLNCADNARTADDFSQTAAWQNEAETRMRALAEPSMEIQDFLLRSRGKLANARGDFQGAIAVNTALLTRLRARAEIAPSDIATLQHGLGVARFRLGDSTGAIVDLGAALASHERTFGPDAVHVASSRRALALAFDDAGESEQANFHMRLALKSARAHFAPDSADFALTLRDAGLLAIYENRSADGDALLLEALAANARGYGQNHSVSLQIRLVLWEIALNAQRWPDAQKQAQFFHDLPAASTRSSTITLAIKRLRLQQARSKNDPEGMAEQLAMMRKLLPNIEFLSDEERAKALYQMAAATLALNQQEPAHALINTLTTLHTKMPQTTRRSRHVGIWLAELRGTQK